MQEVLDNILLRTYRNGLIPAAGEDGCVTGTETIFNSMSNLQQQRHNAAAAAQLMFELNLAKLATAVSLQGGNVERRGDGSMEMLNTSLMPSRAISSVISTASSSTSPNGSLIRCPVSTNSNNSIDFNHSFHGSSSLEQMKSTPVYPHKVINFALSSCSHMY
jgi:hypothetical protein